MPGSDSTHAINNSAMDIMDATALSRWTRFALKGGIGQCTATTDYLAEGPDDLMFLTGDQITVLMQIDEHSGNESQSDWYLGYCEGVVGRFQGKHVEFHAKLKKPVMARRQSLHNTTSLSPQPATSQSPAPTLAAQSPPPTVSTFSPTQTPTLSTFLPHTAAPRESEDSPVLPICHSPGLHGGPARSSSATHSTKSPTPPPFVSDDEQGADITRRPSQSTVSSRYSFNTHTSSSASSPLQMHRALEAQEAQRDEGDDGDDGFGIGFALMQGDDSEDSEDDSHSTKGTPVPSSPPEPEHTISSGDTPAAVVPELSTSPSSPPPEPPFFPSSPSTRDSLRPSVHSASEWESDMDIYDDYRYSRYSAASRMSRFSQISTATRATGMADIQPPVPRRPSLDSRPDLDPTRPIQDRKGSLGSPIEAQSSVPSSLNLRSTPPAPLDLSRKSGKVLDPPSGQVQPSPLLHTTWGSPESSPEPTSIKSPGSARFVFGFEDEGGIASAMRRRLEGERVPEPVRKERSSLYLGRGIVVEDDEAPKEVPSTSPEPQPPDIQVDEESSQPQPDRVTPPPSPLTALPPPSPLSAPAPASFARPTLSDLRETVDPVTRTSLFLPHPNAPRPNRSSGSQGPKYIQPEVQMPAQQVSKDGSLIHVMLQALSTPPLDRMRGPTIYGRLKENLSMSMGPVGVWFTLTPVLATAPPPGSRPPHPQIASPMPRRAATTPMIPPALMGMVEEDRPNPESEHQPKPQGEPLPRNNFTPQTGPRPRSRSFSGFDSGSSMPIPKPTSREEPARLTPTNTPNTPTRSTSLQVSSPQAPAPSPARTPRSKVPQPKANHAPSPLSLPQNNSVVTPPTAVQHLRHVSSSSALEENRLPSSRKTSNASVHSHLRHLSSALSRHSASSPTPASSIQESVESRSTGTASPSPSVGVTRNSSLRSKLSLPNLRRRGSVSSDHQATTVQVDDMDFELVRPQIPTIRSPRTSEDSKGSILGRESLTDSLSRTDSPSLSIAPRSPATTVSSSSPFQGSSWPLAPVSPEDIEAHRNRELRWMSLMSSTPASQSRKSKKVKKLVYEGVPSSVRSLVWGHLTDGKAKEVAGVYRQLATRGKESGKGEVVENDLRDTLSGYSFITEIVETQTIELLRAYQTMVPDIVYRPGITLVAATLLTVIPEEDAFWTFVSVVDTHLRPYFAPQSMQMEVDAELFSRTLEANDPSVFKKIYVDLHINPREICAPWFESVFANALPPEMLHRVWDLFLFEGIPFLFRVGLAIVSCCRRQIMELPITAQDSVEKTLKYLHRPTASWLPPSVDGFMTLVAIGKVKEDEMKKLREKMVGQLQTRKSRPKIASPIVPKR